VAREDNPGLDIHDITAFLRHLLERIDGRNDVHFQTATTIDTLDYSGHGFNQGSKVVLAAVGPPRRTLPTALPAGVRLPDGFSEPRVCLPGVLAVQAPAYQAGEDEIEPAVRRFCDAVAIGDPLEAFPLIVLVDDSDFTARHLNHFLWVTFTRANPAADLHGIRARTWRKHWGCEGPLVIDARIKPHHAPPLVEDPDVTKRVDALAAPGRALHGIL
jgi:4-hydroxy-3-polyprenylbenzoate decarboxylase